MSKFCSVCGAALEEGAGFCSNCGANNAPVAPDAMTGPVLSPQPAPQPAQQQPAPFQPIRQPRPQARVARPINADNQQFQVATPNTPGAEEKSRMGLGIGVTVAIVLGIAALIAGAIILIVVFKPFSSSSPSPQDLADKENEIYYNTDEPDIEAYLENHFNYTFNLSESEKTNERAKAAVEQKENRQSYKQLYGDDFTVETKVMDYDTLAGKRLENARWEYTYSKSSVDEPIEIEELRRALVSYTVTGSKKTETLYAIVDFLKKDGRWYIGNALEYDDYVPEN